MTQPQIQQSAIAVDQVFDAWNGLITRRPWRCKLTLILPIKQSTLGGSGACLVRASDGQEYWIKTINNQQGVRVPVTEQIVGRAGALIGAPTCPVATIFIPSGAIGWEFRPGAQLQRGFAHASLAIGSVIEQSGPPIERGRDHNAVRHAGYFALFDWCWGGDPQGLLALTNDRAFYSHDHGWFLPPEGPAWDVTSLRSHAGIPHEFGADDTGMDILEIARLANRLESISRADILAIVSSIPRSWTVSNSELEHVGAFLEYRAPQVAQRLRARFGVTP